MPILPIAPEVPTVKGPDAWFTGDVWFDVVAAPTTFMTQLAMWEAGGDSGVPDTEWADEVTDEQYGA